ncbi:tRNA threonylcarbamoyladenosine dehydratase [Gudongella sp. SC589]|jgi:tRNA A37 threonylcarbamoyladenosine dehydratase|uniref:tRNA threonylcarbamoyladenosine dehydratase n=1 Tax=Gudongella sp. SC589 TaxID=3385990 RepID=UPI003904BA12
MKSRFERSAYLLGEGAMEKLKNATVAVFGVGGVGSYAAEALARTGIGKLVLVDYDIIDVTNINRQVHATDSTVGLPKVDAMKKRLLEINPDLQVVVLKEKYSVETRQKLLVDDYDYIIDAIDMISSKIDLIVSAKSMGIPIVSSMGAGNKLNPTDFKVADIYDTKICPLARVIRQELRKRGIENLKVVYSEEEPLKVNLGEKDRRKAVPGSVGFVPPVVGLIIASEVIKDIVGQEERRSGSNRICNKEGR